MNTYNFIFMMSEVLYWLQHYFFIFFAYLHRWTCAIYYWNGGKTVPPIKNTLLLKSAKCLAEDIRNGELRSKDVVQAYIDRIREVNPYLNAVVQDQFTEALEAAGEVDELIQSGIFSKEELENEKPLLGVPITVKVMLKVKGLRCTAGSRLFKDQIAEEDAPTVKLLKNAGAIIIATTNMPEYALSLETNNQIHGRTCNPYDTSRTPGGSSGGESALLASGASAAGIGNDMVGSLRIPAHFSGIYTHKTSRGLISNDGTFQKLYPGILKYVSTGPMCRYIEDLILMMKILTRKDEKQMNFGKEVDFKKLKLYYYTSIRDPKAVPVDKEIVEGIHKAIHHFSSSYGITAQQLNMPLMNITSTIGFHVMPDAIENFADYLTAGKVKKMNTIGELFKLLFGKSNFSLEALFSVNILTGNFFATKQNILYYQDVLMTLIKEFDNFLDENSVILCPTFPVTAPYHTEITYTLALSMIYTNLYNLTGMPATAIPMGLNRNGMPQGMQVVAKINNDPLTIACAEELSKVFGGWKPPGKG